MKIELEEKEWQSLLNILGNVNMPWVTINPFIVKISQQMQLPSSARPEPIINKPKGNDHDIPTQPGSR
ncbi:MAG TPA: hypothetical protein VF778_12155 [Xanthobacteraceae bacterium]